MEVLYMYIIIGSIYSFYIDCLVEMLKSEDKIFSNTVENKFIRYLIVVSFGIMWPIIILVRAIVQMKEVKIW